MIAWAFLLWSVVGALASARIEREEDTFDENGRPVHGLSFEWRFNVFEQPLLIFAAGPLVWVMAIIKLNRDDDDDLDD